MWVVEKHGGQWLSVAWQTTALERLQRVAAAELARARPILRSVP